MLELLSALGILGTALLLLFARRLLGSRRAGAAGHFSRLERLSTACAVGSMAVLSLSGFGSRLLHQSLSGYLLLLHVACGGVLAAAATVALLFWAPRFAFDGQATGGFAYCTGHRIGFWVLSVALIGLIVTPLAAMLPLLGTDGQAMLVVIHRFCALAAVALALSLIHAEVRLRQARA